MYNVLSGALQIFMNKRALFDVILVKKKFQLLRLQNIERRHHKTKLYAKFQYMCMYIFFSWVVSQFPTF